VDIPPGAECIFLDTMPYARKIERGSSLQAPSDGVYELTSRAARKRFPDADIGFTYRALLGIRWSIRRRGRRIEARRQAAQPPALRYPAITVQEPR
jgi:hypothetical protein